MEIRKIPLMAMILLITAVAHAQMVIEPFSGKLMWVPTATAPGGATSYDALLDATASGTIGMGANIILHELGTSGGLRWGTPTDYFEVVNDAGTITVRLGGTAICELGTYTVADESTALRTGATSDDYANIVSVYDVDGAAYSPVMRGSNANNPYIDLGDVDGSDMIRAYADGSVDIKGTTNFSNGEVATGKISTLHHKVWSFDPDAICNGNVDRLFLMTIGDEAANGIVIDEWRVSFEADPTTEADLDLKSADAFIGVANAAVIDVLDTTSGTASEDTDSNINSGSAVANGKVLYLEFGTAYTETGHQVIFEMWYHYE